MKSKEMEMQFLKVHFDQKDWSDSIPILIKKWEKKKENTLDAVYEL